MLQQPIIHYSAVALLLSLTAVVYLKLATKFNIIDKPNERSSHTRPTIRGGGILFLIAAIAFFTIHEFQYPYFMLGLSLIAAISFIDDLYTLGSKIRLIFQFIAVGLLLYQLGLMQTDYWIIGLLFIVCVGFMNIYNFMDGINGITGLYSLAVLIGLLYLNYEEQIISNDFLIYLLISVLVFGFFNFRKKALFFAGDIGSISMAMCVIFSVLLFTIKTGAPVVLLFVAVYLVDGGLTILKRALKGENILKPHRQHLYQKLVHQAKISHLKVSGSYALLQGVFIVIIALTIGNTFWSQIITIIVSLVVLGILHIIISKRVDSAYK